MLMDNLKSCWFVTLAWLTITLKIEVTPCCAAESENKPHSTTADSRSSTANNTSAQAMNTSRKGKPVTMFCERNRVRGEHGSFTVGETDCPDINDRALTHIYVPWGVPGRAWYTVPPEVYIATSTVPNAGLGAFAATFISAHTWLAMYEGLVTFKEQTDYAWSVENNYTESHMIDAGHIDTSNWLRWINCARTTKEENIIPNMCYGHIYYMTTKPVYPGQELFVYYGDEFAESLNIDHKQFEEPHQFTL